MKSRMAAYFQDALTTAADLRDDPRTVRELQVDQPGHLEEEAARRSGQIRETPDEMLLAQIREGAKEALSLLFRRYARMMRTVAQRILRDPGEAEDLLQEVFLFVFRRAALFDPGRGSARSWLVQVTYHRAFDRRRHLTARHFYTNLELEEAVLGGEEPLAGTSSYEQTLEGALGREALCRIEEALSEDQRRVLRLCFVEGYTLAEIAALLGQTPGNVRNHYYRALEKMRAQVFPAKLQEK
jgi:RNA polymerase sigma-70 factor (ECF subfamily)